MNRDIVWAAEFKKDYKRAIKRHLYIELLDDIIRALIGLFVQGYGRYTNIP